MSDQGEERSQHWIREAQRVRALLQEHGGIPGFEDELIGESLVRPGPKRFVSVTMVWLEDENREPQERGCGLRFAVSDEDHNPLYSFAVDHQLLLAALMVAYPEGGEPPGGDLRCELIEAGQNVWAPAPDGEGELKAVFLAIAVDEPLRVDGIKRDAAWISWEEGEDEGTTARVPYYKLRARKDR